MIKQSQKKISFTKTKSFRLSTKNLSRFVIKKILLSPNKKILYLGKEPPQTKYQGRFNYLMALDAKSLKFISMLK